MPRNLVLSNLPEESDTGFPTRGAGIPLVHSPRETYAYGPLDGDDSRTSWEEVLRPCNPITAAAPEKQPDELMKLEQMRKEKGELETQEAKARLELEDLDMLWRGKRQPVLEEIEELRTQILALGLQISIQENPMLDENAPPPPGPRSLSFVDSSMFGAVCNLVVFINLSTMLLSTKYSQFSILFLVLDQAFLIWYVAELGAKTFYHQVSLYCGKILVVWWNWMDLGIVVGGVVDQWLLPALMWFGLEGTHGQFNSSALRCLRLMRLFRVMRALKLLKSFLLADLSWIGGPIFETFMSSVIAANAIIMSFELDIEWSGWKVVENIFLSVYTIELLIKMNVFGRSFFLDRNDCLWNILDFTIVSGGVFDLWFLPLLLMLLRSFTSTETGGFHSHNLGTIVTLLRMMRLLRVLRLVRLLRSIKPLYRLMVGVKEALGAMKWVIVLTLLVLYAGAILFTTLVGKGLLGQVNEEAQEVFDSVPQSLFSLFKLMNGDTDVVDPITTTVLGRLLFATFMVLSNWAILAILTSVVSDNMISASQKTIQEDEEKSKAEADEIARRRLMAVFREVDQEGAGAVSEAEWKRLIKDKGQSYVLCDASGLSIKDLKDLFQCFAFDPSDIAQESRKSTVKFLHRARPERNIEDGKVLNYIEFIDNMKDEGKAADKRSVLHLMERIRALESRLEKKFSEMEIRAFTSDHESRRVSEVFEQVQIATKKLSRAKEEP